jgi:uncharacterized protein YlxP (DUF503 family)
VAVADLGPDGVYRHAHLAVVTVANEEAHVHRVLAAALRLIEGDPRVVCEASAIEIL